jgi:hypothetical protein
MVGAYRPTKIADSRLPVAYSQSEIRIETGVTPVSLPGVLAARVHTGRGTTTSFSLVFLFSLPQSLALVVA